MERPLYQPFPMGASTARGQAWRHSPSTRRPRHFHDEPELNLIARGRARFGIGDLGRTVEAGDLLWFPPGQDHVLLDASGDLDLYVFAVTPEFYERVLDHDCHDRALTGPTCVHLPPSALNELAELCRTAATTKLPSPEDRLGTLWQAANTLRAAEPPHHPITRRTLRSLLVDPALARGELAEVGRTSPSEISRRFHHDLGLRLCDYRGRLRLMRFIRAVDDGASLTEAAFNAGFGSYSQCHRVFRSAFGYGPRDFFSSSARSNMAERVDPAPAVHLS